jgi:hypothetical protein
MSRSTTATVCIKPGKINATLRVVVTSPQGKKGTKPQESARRWVSLNGRAPCPSQRSRPHEEALQRACLILRVPAS